MKRGFRYIFVSNLCIKNGLDVFIPVNRGMINIVPNVLLGMGV